MNNPKSIFTAPRPYLKRRHSDSVKDIAAGSGIAPLSHSSRNPPPLLSPQRRQHQPPPPKEGIWHGRTLPRPYPWTTELEHLETTPTVPINTAITPQDTQTERPPAPKTPDPSESNSLQRKRQRLERRPDHNLDKFDFVGPSENTNTPPSPLFFSHSSHIRPQLPPRFSSSEAAAKMLSKTRGEDTGIKTVRLARGTPASGSPPPLRSTPRSSHADHDSASRTGSPELSEKLDTARSLAQVGIVELLDQDERPTFIVDLNDGANYDSHRLRVAYANAALRGSAGLLDIISGKIEIGTPRSFVPGSLAHFKPWLLGVSSQAEPLDISPYAFNFAGLYWTYSTLRKRLRVVRGITTSPVVKTPASSVGKPRLNFVPGIKSPLERSHNASDSSEPSDYFGSNLPSPTQLHHKKTEDEPLAAAQSVEDANATDVQTESAVRTRAAIYERTHSGSWGSRTSSSSESFAIDAALPSIELKNAKDMAFFDWTRLPESEALPQHIQFARAVDWASTPLGAMETWSADLRQMCNLIMASPHPSAMYWGDDLICMYNEAYVNLAGYKHPTLMGRSYRDAWAEIWDEVKDVFENAQKTGQATMKDDDCLFMDRQGFLEETYFSWSIIPIVGGDGTVMGLYNPAFEKTRRKVAERRMLTLREVGERTAAARDVSGFWAEVLRALEYNEYDTPFVLLYSLSDESESDDSSVASSSMAGAKVCNLEGALGVPDGHVAAPKSVDLKSGEEGWVPVFREVLKTSRTKVLDIGSGQFPPSLLQGLEWRGFGDPARSVVVCPIHPTTGESTLGFLVMGINPRRPYDDDYSLFLQLLSRQLATSLASVVLFEEEIKRGETAARKAALERIELSEQLAARTQEAIESETKFTRMAEFAPVGMFIADSQGRITYCNDTWYEISRVPRDVKSTDTWIEWVADDDKTLVRAIWYDLVVNTKSATAEFRFKAPWLDRTGTSGDTWVLFSAFPEQYSNGALKGVFGSITNISQQKWAEGFQKRKTEEAIELKRQQENFIDITSHEMRNPLSAILQCADEIVLSLSEARSRKNDVHSDSTLDDNIDAAQTIALCAQHQKRIVDDILTLSKLDSALLMVTPVDVQPLAVVQKALKMFEGELQTSDIAMNFSVHPSFNKLGIDWVRLDPSRVLQVLINLTTNAIKFTTQQTKREIKVSLAASSQRPKSSEHSVDFFPSRSKRMDVPLDSEWGDGPEIFLIFTVQDTGRGLTAEEMKLLFMRFRQASPRTHVQYGGSGLGLFISRELTELQGGEIGVESEAGKGSTFSFYVRARKSTVPKSSSDLPTSSSTLRKIPPERGFTSNEPPPPTIKDFAAGDKTTEDRRKGPEASELKILIVEDNLVNQRVLQKQLTKLGAETHVANHGGEAIEQLCQSTFWVDHAPDATDLSVVLMDQEMPVMDGLTCTRRIRELEKEGKLLRRVPIIAVTANARSEQIKTALEAGMDDVVSKPFRIPDLIPKIQELIAKCNAEATG